MMGSVGQPGQQADCHWNNMACVETNLERKTRIGTFYICHQCMHIPTNTTVCEIWFYPVVSSIKLTATIYLKVTITTHASTKIV